MSVFRIHYMIHSSHRPHNKHSYVQLHILLLCAHYITLYYPPTFLITNMVRFCCSSSVCVKITVPCTILPTSSQKHSNVQLHFLYLCSDYIALYYPPKFLIITTVLYSCNSYVCVNITVPCTILPPSS
jgi:hypothetical protein